MLPEVEKLVRVQHHDQKIQALDKEIAGIPVEEEDIRDRLEADQKAVDTAKLTFQETEVAIKNLELDIETRKDSINKLKVQQFETKKNDEFTRMGSDIERYEAEIITMEDSEIELMEKAEAEKEVLDAAKAKLAENEGTVDEEIADLKSLGKNLEKEKAEELEKRTEHATAVEKDLLYTYDRLFKAKAGMAVVGLVDQVCQGCRMKVTKSTMIETKAENKLATCENCGRILYWWTDDSVGKNMGEY